MKNFKNIEKKIINEMQNSTPKPKVLFYEIEHEYISTTIEELIKENLVEPIILKYEKEQINSALAQKVRVITCEELFNEETVSFFSEILSKAKKSYSKEQIEAISKKKNFLAAMLVKTKIADGYIAGIIHTTADVLSPALKIIKKRADAELVVSTRFLYNETNILALSDTTLIIDPTNQQIFLIAKELYTYFKTLNVFDHYTFALLSYSTLDSGSGPNVDKVREATEQAKEYFKNNQNVNILGPVQFDAAYDLRVRMAKMGENVTMLPANIYVFPSLQAANISYKIIQNLAGWNNASLPLVGLNGNVTDLSRGVCQKSIKIATMLLAYKIIQERN